MQISGLLKEEKTAILLVISFYLLGGVVIVPRDWIVAKFCSLRF